MTPPRRAGARAVALAVGLTALLASCRGGERATAGATRGDELETIEVAPPPDALVDPSTDVKEKRRAESFAGVLPAGFPRGLPVPHGSSLVDQGPRWVELLVGRPLASVRGEYTSQLRSAGWQVVGRGSSLQLSRGGISVSLGLHAAESATRLRLEY